MEIKWNDVYIKLIHEIRKYKNEEKFLSERKICEKFNISRPTAQKVVEKLKLNGLLISIPKRGLFVTSNTAKGLKNFEEKFPNMTVKKSIENWEIVTHPMLGSCLYFEKRRTVEGKLVNFEKTYISKNFLPSKIDEDVIEKIQISLFKYLSDNNLCNITHSDKHITYDVFENEPVTKINTTIYEEYNEICIISTMYEPATQLDYSFTEFR